jgi:signal transduction histidine kinase
VRLQEKKGRMPRAGSPDLHDDSSAWLGLQSEASAAAPMGAIRAGREPQAAADRNLSIVLMDGDVEAAESTGTLLERIFGDRCRRDWAGDASELAGFVQRNEHDIYLIAEDRGAGDTVEIVRSCIDSGCRRPIIVLARDANTDVDLRAVDAGAADCLPMDELTAGVLERSIRHALLREHGIARARLEAKQLSAELARLNTLRDANHRFVDNACHDFRSPLTVIKEFASIIAEGLSGDVNEEQAEFLGIILTRVDQLSHMVDSILDASRLESDLISVHREKHTPAELIERTRPTLEQQAKSRGAEVTFAVADALPSVFADAESVGRIIVNLVTNACKFAGEGGKIEVWARPGPDDGSVTIGVTDNGPGIAPEHVKLIFERFRQIDEESEAAKAGFGLGLHIASELARLNFGTLTVDSAPQKGSTFAFTLPVFDVGTLIPLHFGFLKTSRHRFQGLSIALATAVGEGDGASFAELERFLNRQLRSYDLLLRLGERTWLTCIACDENDLAGITGRIQRAYAEHNRNRPLGALPDIGFRPVGMWMLANQPQGLTEAIRSAYALGGEAAAVH